MKSCGRSFGCHSCIDNLTMLHCAIKQILKEPSINQERLKNELTSVQHCIEDILNYEREDEV